MIYFTPLFLYGLYTNKTVIRLLPLSINYVVQLADGGGHSTPPRKRRYSVTMEKLYNLHIGHKKSGLIKGRKWYDEEDIAIYCEMIPDIHLYDFPFHSCLICEGYLRNRNVCDSDQVFRWFSRIEKYIKRLPNNEVIYVSVNKTYGKNYYIEQKEITQIIQSNSSDSEDEKK